MNNWGFTREIVYRASDGGGIDYPEERLPKDIDIQRSPKGLIGETGELGPNYITGICLMPPRYTQNLENGVNPVTGEELESYDEFQDLLETDLPALSTLTDQFGLTELDEGKVVVTVEDEEWSDRLSNYLQDAGIKFDEEQVERDVRDAYNDQMEVFRTYIQDILSNSVDIDGFFTSNYSQEIDQILEAETRDINENISEDDWFGQRIRMYFDPAYAKFVENRADLDEGSSSFIEPLRFYEQLYVLDPFSILADKEEKYWDNSNANRDYEIGFVPPLLDPKSKGINPAGVETSETTINPSNCQNILDSLDPSQKTLAKSGIFRLSTGFPNLEDEATDLISAREQISSKKSKWKDEGMKEGLSGSELGDFFSRKKQSIWEEDGEDLMKALKEALIQDIQTLFEGERR